MVRHKANPPATVNHGTETDQIAAKRRKTYRTFHRPVRPMSAFDPRKSRTCDTQQESENDDEEKCHSYRVWINNFVNANLLQNPLESLVSVNRATGCSRREYPARSH